MKVTDSIILNSGRRQIERYVCAVLQNLLCHCAWQSEKRTLVVAVIGCNAADNEKKNQQF